MVPANDALVDITNVSPQGGHVNTTEQLHDHSSKPTWHLCRYVFYFAFLTN